MCGVNVMESILNVRSQNEAALLPVHAVVMMALDFGNVVPIVIVIVMGVRYCVCELMQQRHEGRAVCLETMRKHSELMGFLDFAHRNVL
jgi:hypothetical protein